MGRIDLLGAVYDAQEDLTRFLLWAPKANQVHILNPETGKQWEATPKERGYFELACPELKLGDKYFYLLDGDKKLPDPVSRYQPDGVHGPSEIVPHEFAWTDHGWQGVPLQDLVIYELHPGTFSQEGTFEGIQSKLSHLVELGVTAVEIMPVAQFPGAKNWGYDGVFPFATQNSYGGPVALKKLVNACHESGLSVFLDVVYNHLGPEGNYLPQFGHYFQDRYHTPWGPAINFDGPDSDEVKRYYLQNALQWLDEFHFDGLRLDAIQTICDMSVQPFLTQLSNLADQLNARLSRTIHIIGETDTNDARLLQPVSEGGTGLSGHWADDFHHNVHSLLTGETSGYYQDYGGLEQLADCYRHGVTYRGQYSEFRKRSHGRSYSGIPRSGLVACIQNHDQIGNRCYGERLASLLDEESLKLAAGCLFLSPFLPLMFMGEEYADQSPFLYFIDHGDPDLVAAVRKGRKEEFQAFSWDQEPPDPADDETFLRCVVRHDRAADEERAQKMVEFYKTLIKLSKKIRHENLFGEGKVNAEVLKSQGVLTLWSTLHRSYFKVIFNFGKTEFFKAQIDGEVGSSELFFSSEKSTREGERICVSPRSFALIQGMNS